MIKITRDDFSVDDVHKGLKNDEVGCIVSFVGTVRGLSGGDRVKRLDVEAYEDMALKELEEIRRRAVQLFQVKDVNIVHRVGSFEVGENIVLVSVSSPHRKEAFEACGFVIDELKRLVPIWKKEFTASEGSWVAGRQDV